MLYLKKSSNKNSSLHYSRTSLTKPNSSKGLCIQTQRLGEIMTSNVIITHHLKYPAMQHDTELPPLVQQKRELCQKSHEKMGTKTAAMSSREETRKDPLIDIMINVFWSQ